MALFTIRSGATAHPEDSILQMVTDLLRNGGVKDLTDTDHLLVSQRGAGANMSIDVNTGRAFVMKIANAYPVRNTATINQAISSNVSGNPRIDAIIVYIDLAATPTSTGGDVAKIGVVQGTPSASPTAPTDSAIEDAVGASTPFERLAHVTVASGAATIVDANISDQRRSYRSPQDPENEDITYASSVELDFSNKRIKSLTLTGNISFTAKNVEAGRGLVLRLKQDGSGNRVVSSWFSGITIVWQDGSAPTITPTANRTTVVGFLPITKTLWDGYILGNNMY